ncbi:MAG: symmetrical bis(5'-nucleosyl)-tetraphosphatase [Gammaproteobacteria bacterium]
MATYAIGDVQGCYGELLDLLATVAFDESCDRLWFAGDLVNRGPQSGEVLRFVKSLGARAVSVLGNHDLHLIALAYDRMVAPRKGDTLRQVLAGTDADELVTWLRFRPFLHHEPDLGFTLVHAGLPPQWDLQTAGHCASEVEAVLRSETLPVFLPHMYGNQPLQWDESLSGWERLRFIINCFTRMRFCDIEGRLDLSAKGAPGSQPPPFVPWYEVPGRRSQDLRIVFGHWSTLRLSERAQRTWRVFPLDTGCVWGGELTAMRLEDGRLFSVAGARTHRVPVQRQSGPT